MKIRQGFVSNSSSSSFVAVGISRPDYYKPKEEDKKLWEDLLNAIGAPVGDYDYEDIDTNKNVSDYGYGIYTTTDGSNVYLYGGCEFYFAGFDAMPLFNKDMKLSEIKKLFRDTVKKKYGVTVPLKKIKLESGETSSE